MFAALLALSFWTLGTNHPPATTNISVAFAWNWPIDPTVTNFNFYWGPLNSETNRVVCNTNFAKVSLPVGVYNYCFVRSVSSVNGLESTNSNEVHWPFFRAITITGTNLQCSTDLKTWTKTNSPWSMTNVTGNQFFRATSKPIITNWWTQ